MKPGDFLVVGLIGMVVYLMARQRSGVAVIPTSPGQIVNPSSYVNMAGIAVKCPPGQAIGSGSTGNPVCMTIGTF